MKKALKSLSISATVVLWALSSVSLAQASGGETGGGGDICEDRIKIIRDDFTSWIHRAGHVSLRFPQSFSSDQYSSQMLTAMSNTKIKCLGLSDPGFPVQVNSTPKVCRFDKTLPENAITCDLDKFNALSASDQYVLVHHEYAGIAGIEVPNGDDSNYEISNQISGHLADQVVRKLVVATSPNDVAENFKTLKRAFETAEKAKIADYPLITEMGATNSAWKCAQVFPNGGVDSSVIVGRLTYQGTFSQGPLIQGSPPFSRLSPLLRNIHYSNEQWINYLDGFATLTMVSNNTDSSELQTLVDAGDSKIWTFYRKRPDGKQLYVHEIANGRVRYEESYAYCYLTQ